MVVDLSNNRTTIAVTGTAWMGGGVISVQSAIEELFKNSKQEILIGIYEITAGAEDFLNNLQICLARGIQIRMIINNFHMKPQPIKERLLTLMKRFPYFQVFSFQPESEFEDLHAKIIVADRDTALVGSANLTWRGLVGNHELAVLLHGAVASKIGALFDRLSQDSRVIRLGIT